MLIFFNEYFVDKCSEVELEVEVELDLKMSILNYFKKTASKAVEEFTYNEIPTITVREREEVVESLEHLEERGKTQGKYLEWRREKRNWDARYKARSR